MLAGVLGESNKLGAHTTLVRLGLGLAVRCPVPVKGAGRQVK